VRSGGSGLRKKREDLMCAAAIMYVLGKLLNDPNDWFLAFEGTEIHVTDK
jgi:hypothetical protein